HDLDWLMSVFGKVRRVHAIGWQSPTKCWNHIVSHLLFKNGIKISCETSIEMPVGYPFSVGYRIVGDRGGLEYNFTAGFNIHDASVSELIRYGCGGERTVLPVQPADSVQTMLDAFLSSLSGNGPLPVTREETLGALELVQAIAESLETGKPAEVPD
ncbi:MAG: Gfo/Idh/MocA family oxidoreductase, partial [Clostridia bacterium]|nr:Gfo/Idh/MocA family oxidoreductase [Clostridia bacterium]